MNDPANPFHSIISITHDENSPLSFGRSGSNPPYVYAFQLKLKNEQEQAQSVSSVVVSSDGEVKLTNEGNAVIPAGDTRIFVLPLPPMDDSPMENGLFFDDFQKQFGTFEVKVTLADGSYGSWVFAADVVFEMLEAGAKAVAR